MDNLGENVVNRDEALRSRDLYHELFEQVHKQGLDLGDHCKTANDYHFKTGQRK